MLRRYRFWVIINGLLLEYTPCGIGICVHIYVTDPHPPPKSQGKIFLYSQGNDTADRRHLGGGGSVFRLVPPFPSGQVGGRGVGVSRILFTAALPPFLEHSDSTRGGEINPKNS